MVIVHVVLIAVVVELYVCFPVVGGVDVEFAIEDMGRRVGSVNVTDDRLVRHDGL